MELDKWIMLSDALYLCVTRHHGQSDKGGKPYALHPLKVMHYLKNDSDVELQCIALLHDIIEDTSTTYAELSRCFSDRVINGIKSLTKVPGETYEEYKEKVLGNVDAMKVKLADLRHNTDIRRLKGVTEKDKERVARYHQFYVDIQFKLKELEM